MNYTEIKSLALGYADRSDAEVSDQVDNFLKIVEARVNKKLKTQKMGSQSFIPIVADTNVYDLPSDFAGLRLAYISAGGSSTPGALVTPEFFLNLRSSPQASAGTDNNGFYYSIITDQLRTHPDQEVGSDICLIYYKRVPELTSSEPDNWLAADHPDCYVFGLMVEISAFVKDAEAKQLWENRFKESMTDIHIDDQKSRWSGAPMQVRVE